MAELARRIAIGVSATLLILSLLGTGAYALGKPHLVTTCIRDAASNYRLINNPRYVVPMLEIIAGFGDNRTVVFIECPQVEGIFAFYPTDDPDMQRQSYIVYDPSFVRVAAQADKTKLTFLLAHEYGHFSEGHFGEQRDLTVKQKELAADAKGACAVARQNGDLSSLVEIVRGLRDDADVDTGGYPSFPESEQAVRQAYQTCTSGAAPVSESVLPRSRVRLFEPDAVTVKSVSRSIDWLTSAAWHSNLANIRNLKTRLPQAGVAEAAPSMGQISSLWKTDPSLFLVIKNSSDAIEDAASGPTFAGVFYIGPFASDADDAVIQLGLSQSFTKDVTDPARTNLLLTEKIAQVVLAYAALKYALETGQPKSVLTVVAQNTDFALTDLKRFSGDVTDFPTWTAALEAVTEKLDAARS